jgi:hypothetical protein
MFCAAYFLPVMQLLAANEKMQDLEKMLDHFLRLHSLALDFEGFYSYITKVAAKCIKAFIRSKVFIHIMMGYF